MRLNSEKVLFNRSFAKTLLFINIKIFSLNPFCLLICAQGELRKSLGKVQGKCESEQHPTIFIISSLPGGSLSVSKVLSLNTSQPTWVIEQGCYDYSGSPWLFTAQDLCSQSGTGRAAGTEKNPIPRVQPEMETFQKMMINRKERVMVTTGLKLLCAGFSSPCGFEEGGKREEEEMCLNYWP